jgi:hypothetical protein
MIVVWLEVEILEIGTGGNKRGWAQRVGWMGEEIWGMLSFVALVCISNVVVEGACVRDCRVWGVCTVGRAG